MIRLSVNINKIATLRNARGGNVPDLIKAAKNIERFGAQGITVHPRPDERHIRYHDVYELKKVLSTEFNIEGNPREKKFIDLVMDVNPHQVTLVPDEEGQITSDHGWDTVKHKEYLRETIAQFKSKGIRVSIFVDANTTMIKGAANTGTDRIELYTEEYARLYPTEKENVILKFSEAAKEAHKLGLGVNAGHDLNLENLRYFKSHIPELKEVSIGHALISDALYFGLENTIQMYLRQLQ
ncbi:MAG: pyridoxine 5'-phosphate synthase [Bacteroidia bacterium]|jgi:pyridoxine 5-phosphate synthase|nr:pyridoxine 5'-phosphate synthase [Bacteroidia bacterium]